IPCAALALVSCAVVLAARPAAAAEQPGPPPVVATVEPPKAPPPPAPAHQPPAPPRLRIVHPQVSQASLVREYRSLPMQSAEPVVRASDARIRAALGQEIAGRKWSFAETPLRDVVAHIKDGLGLPIAIDMKALEDAGIDLETPISLDASAGTFRSTLRRILDPIGLTWMVRDECLLITTRETAVENLAVRLYPLPCAAASDADADPLAPLVDVIQNTTGGVAAWADFGGHGTVRPSPDGAGLVIAQTEETHDEVEGLMRSLHDRGLAELGLAADGAAARSPIVRVHPVADAKVRSDLAAKLVGLCNESLAKAGDPQAKVTAVGECLTVQSASPEFHILAGQLIRGVAGVEVPDRRGLPPGAIGFSPPPSP
ncbi:MAG: hypothetical protein ACKOC4_00320, partial [Planctomycetia bacterium]